MDEEEIKIKGRDKFLERMKSKNPDYNPENDDMLWDDVDSMYSETETTLGKHAEASKRLQELVAKDPKLGAVISLIAGDNPKSLPYAVAKIYGKDVFNLEGEELDNFENGYQEYIKEQEEMSGRHSTASENFKKSMADLDAYCQENGIQEEEKSALIDKGFEIADNYLMGVIPWEMVHKSMNYDKDVQEAADTGFVEGKNEKIDMKKKDVNQIMPDLASATGAGKVKQAAPKKGSFFDNLKTV